MNDDSTAQPSRALVGADGAVGADVVVVGDGPAGAALAAALQRAAVDVVLVGPGRRWDATYTGWIDDLDGVQLLAGADIWAHRFDSIEVRFARTHRIDRAYGVVDNDALRRHLLRGVRRVVGVVDDPDELIARLVVDATGWPSRLAGGESEPPGWQTAFGVVLAEPPAGALGRPTMMDFSDPGAAIAGREAVPTFAYSLPVVDGWLVEETVLTASPAVNPMALRSVLAARLSMSVEELLDAATRTEVVKIPMGAAPPPVHSGIVRFGAAAGMIHPATGYSVAAALRGAERVAGVIATELDATPLAAAVDPAPVRAAIWSNQARRTRHLQDFGHDVLLGLDRAGIQRFFDAFFDLDPDVWPHYLRIDTPPRRLAGVMTQLFAAAPWPLRRQLMRGNPSRFIRLLRRS